MAPSRSFKQHLGLITMDSTAAVPFAVMFLSSFMTSMALHIGVYSQPLRVPLSRNSIVAISLFSLLWHGLTSCVRKRWIRRGRMRPITMGPYNFIGHRIRNGSH